MRSLWLTSSILSTASSIQPFANEAEKNLLQSVGFSLLPLQNLCRGEWPYVSLPLSQTVLWDDVRSLIISEVPHNTMIREMMECLLKALEIGWHLPLKLSECSCSLALNQEMLRGLEAAWFKLTRLCPRLREQHPGRFHCHSVFKSAKKRAANKDLK